MTKKKLHTKLRRKPAPAALADDLPLSASNDPNHDIAAWSEVENADYQGWTQSPVPDFTKEDLADAKKLAADLRIEESRSEQLKHFPIYDAVQLRRGFREQRRKGDLNILGTAFVYYLKYGIPLEAWAIREIEKRLKWKGKLKPPSRLGRPLAIGSAAELEQLVRDVQANIAAGISRSEAVRRAAKKRNMKTKAINDQLRRHGGNLKTAPK